MTKEELMKWHEPRVKLLYESNCDILAIETMPGIKEADAILDLLEKYDKGLVFPINHKKVISNS